MDEVENKPCFVLALDLSGHLVEIQGSFESYIDLIKYLHKWYKSYKDLSLYVVCYDNGINNDPTGGNKYEFNMDTYYSCEDGVYYEEHYDEIGQGVKEIGSRFLVNNDLLPQDLQEDGELVEIAIEKWINSHLSSPKVNPATVKPIWLI